MSRLLAIPVSVVVLAIGLGLTNLVFQSPLSILASGIHGLLVGYLASLIFSDSSNRRGLNILLPITTAAISFGGMFLAFVSFIALFLLMGGVTPWPVAPILMGYAVYSLIQGLGVLLFVPDKKRVAKIIIASCAGFVVGILLCQLAPTNPFIYGWSHYPVTIFPPYKLIWSHVWLFAGVGALQGLTIGVVAALTNPKAS